MQKPAHYYHALSLFIKNILCNRLTLLSMGFGLFIWGMDAAVDWLFFSNASFWNLLILDIPTRALYIRLLLLFLFIILGVMFNSVIVIRKKTEAKLRQSEHIISSVFSYANIGIAVTGSDGKWLRINDRYCEMLGYSRSELEAMTWLDITHPDDIEKDRMQYKRILDGVTDNYKLEKRFISKGGEYVASTYTGCNGRG